MHYDIRLLAIQSVILGYVFAFYEGSSGMMHRLHPTTYVLLASDIRRRLSTTVTMHLATPYACILTLHFARFMAQDRKTVEKNHWSKNINKHKQVKIRIVGSANYLSSYSEVIVQSQGCPILMQCHQNIIPIIRT